MIVSTSKGRMWMKKWLFVLLLFLMSLSGCSEQVTPMENPDEDAFSTFYVGDDFSILKRILIEDKSYYMIGYMINDGYALGAVHMDNYRVLYKDEYYDLQQGYTLGLYEAEDLLDIGITNISRSCSANDTCD